MIVGETGSGKSVMWKILRNTLTRLKKENRGPQYQIVKVGWGQGSTIITTSYSGDITSSSYATRNAHSRNEFVYYCCQK